MMAEVILSQSSYFARSMDLLAPHEPLRIQLTDPEITDEVSRLGLPLIWCEEADANARSVP